MKIIAILAHDEANGIGKDGQLPWKNSEDLVNFKAIMSAIFMKKNPHLFLRNGREKSKLSYFTLT